MPARGYKRTGRHKPVTQCGIRIMPARDGIAEKMWSGLEPGFPGLRRLVVTSTQREDTMIAQATRTIGRIALLATLMVTASTALASAQSFSAEQRRLCTGDAFRLCSSAIPNIEEVTICMRKQKTSLSSGCKAVFDKPVVTAVSNKED